MWLPWPGISIRSSSEKILHVVRFLKITTTGTTTRLCGTTGRKIGCSAPARNASAIRALRRMFALAMEWGKVERVLPRVRMLPGEAHRERVISVNEEKVYLEAAQGLGIATL